MFGDGDKNSRVTSIGTDAFNGASGLTNVVLNAAANLTVGANAFAGASGIKTVTFLGPAVSEDAFGGILAGVAASDTAKPVIVYVSEFQPTWLQTGYFARRSVGGGVPPGGRTRTGRLSGGGGRAVGQGVGLPSAQSVRSERYAFHHSIEASFVGGSAEAVK